jgi:hypothetical protein
MKKVSPMMAAQYQRSREGETVYRSVKKLFVLGHLRA